MWCNCVGFVWWLAPLLFFEALAIYRFVSQLIFCRNVVLPLPITCRVLAMGGIFSTEAEQKNRSLILHFG
jgi:hypothetical protein